MKEIPLTQGQVAFIDDEDYERVIQYRWYASRTSHDFRAKGYVDGRFVHMSRFIVSAPAGTVVDHVDHNTLNNQKANLRICSQSLNNANKIKSRNRLAASKYKGVSWSKGSRRWSAHIAVSGRTIHLGLFETEEQAAAAYDSAAVDAYGSFALTNFPPGTITPAPRHKPFIDASSRYLGVSWYKHGRKWRAYILVNRHQVSLGYFDSEEAAAKAYDAAALKIKGESAFLNFPQSG